MEHEREREGKLRDIAASLTQPRTRRAKPRSSEPTRDVVDAVNAAHQDKLVRNGEQLKEYCCSLIALYREMIIAG